MKALSIGAFYATAIATNFKTIETRSWPTSYRGEILICSTASKQGLSHLKDSLIFGHALAIATIKDCQKFKKSDRQKAMIDRYTNMHGMYSWHLSDIRPIKPIPIKGQQRIYNTDIKKSDLEILNIKNDNELFRYWYENNLIKEIP